MLRAREAGPCYGFLISLLLWGMRGGREAEQVEDVWVEVEEPGLLPELDAAA
jgi:hypothetical protein